MNLEVLSKAIQRAAAILFFFGMVHPTAGADETALIALQLPRISSSQRQAVETDWLVVPTNRSAGVFQGEHAHEIVMTNGLISRTWRLAPNGATVAFDNLMTGESILRGVKPEAEVKIDGVAYSLGGLLGQPEYAYLRPRWLDSMTSDPNAFQVIGHEVGKIKQRFPWKRRRYSANLPWPPTGVSLTLHFAAPSNSQHAGLTASVHYEMYDGIPLLAKWFTIQNNRGASVRINRFVSEILAVQSSNMHVESDYAINGSSYEAANQTTHWGPDPQYDTERIKTPLLLKSRLPLGPDVTIEPGGTFESFRTFELIYDSTERERKGLTLRRMYRVVAPWITENPIYMHVRNFDPAAIRLAIDQCAEVGFEMVVITFGSGLNMENETSDYRARVKELTDYAHSRGIQLGGYSLLASRTAGAEHDVVQAETGRTDGAVYGHAPCLGSSWGEDYLRKIKEFLDETGMDVLEHDGSYAGDFCASTKHPGHSGLADSQWIQWKKITDLYRWCLARGVYLNVPDWYFLNGSSKIFFGYREENWTLPHARQILLARQNIYDGTWEKTPSMGWMFVPLSSYKGGGADSMLEPLSEHLGVYERHLANNFGCGVQACYRGPRLYDTDETKAVVKKWVDFYKKYRGILNSDILHVRRPDGRDLDCILHVNSQLVEKGLVLVFNPLPQPIERTLELPLYYTGLTETATISEKDREPKSYKLDRRFKVKLPVKIDANSNTWFLIR